jgi:hypothetical protein
MDRRNFLVAIAALSGTALTLNVVDAQAGPLRRRRRRVRRRIFVRRRIRRHAFTRIVFGRPFWVVPLGLAVGWELAHADRVVVVKEIKVVEKDGNKIEVATVEDSKGKSEQIEITREDTAENSKNLEGTKLAANDTSTPSVEHEEEIEVEEEE